jgi:hypothetical protein
MINNRMSVQGFRDSYTFYYFYRKEKKSKKMTLGLWDAIEIGWVGLGFYLGLSLELSV